MCGTISSSRETTTAQPPVKLGACRTHNCYTMTTPKQGRRTTAASGGGGCPVTDHPSQRPLTTTIGSSVGLSFHSLLRPHLCVISHPQSVLALAFAAPSAQRLRRTSSRRYSLSGGKGGGVALGCRNLSQPKKPDACGLFQSAIILNNIAPSDYPSLPLPTFDHSLAAISFAAHEHRPQSLCVRSAQMRIRCPPT